MTLIPVSAYIVWGVLTSLLPPFYTKVADTKGATPSQVKLWLFLENFNFIKNRSFSTALFFGSANLAAFLSAPIFGR
jgi:hypothetical protein